MQIFEHLLFDCWPVNIDFNKNSFHETSMVILFIRYSCENVWKLKWKKREMVYCITKEKKPVETE